MNRLLTTLVVALAASLLAVPALATWQSDIIAMLETDDPVRQEELMQNVLAENPDWQEATKYLATGPQFGEPQVTGGFFLAERLCIDGVTRPYAIYVPGSYDPAKASGLLVWLHGGVSRAELYENPLEYAQDNYFQPLAEELGMLMLYPFGQQGATWWDETGMENISGLVRDVKRGYNIDDDRVYMLGYSDGASAGFAWGMLRPSDFGGFIALSGHIGVGSLDGDLLTYASNLANTPLYAVTSFDDGLYPSAQMRTTLQMALRAGGDVLYREQEGGHDFSYHDAELPLVADFIRRHPRDPHPPKITWESASAEFGRCHWLEILEVANEPPAPWHEDHNAALESDRITIGFMPDDGFAGEGMAVGSVIEDSFAEDIGLTEGDIIVAADNYPIVDGGALGEWKETKQRGDAVVLEVLRKGSSNVLKGQLPPVELYNVFKRDRPSARVVATYEGNRFHIRASRLGKLRLLLSPAMVRFERPISVSVNGEEVFSGMVEPDLELMLREHLDSRDRSALYAAELVVGPPS